MMQKNALREHFIAPYTGSMEPPAESEYLPLDRWITEITPDNEEDVSTQGFYHGDGTPEQNVLSIALGYAFTGFFDAKDPAHMLINSIKREILEGRYLWHKIKRPNTNEKIEGLANASGIVTDGGEATADEDFAVNLRYMQRPDVTKLDEGVSQEETFQLSKKNTKNLKESVQKNV